MPCPFNTYPLQQLPSPTRKQPCPSFDTMFANSLGSKQVDYVKLAAMLGLSHPRSAANLWGNVKKKMGWNHDASACAYPKSAGSPAGGKAQRATPAAKRKAAAAAEAAAHSESDDEHDKPTPGKKVKAAGAGAKTPRRKLPASKAAKSAPAAVSDDEEEQGGAAGAKVKTEVPVKQEPEPEVESDGT